MFPGDAIVLEARDLFVTQAALTGESVPVEKVPGPRDAASSALEDVVPASAVENNEDVALLDRTTVGFAGTSVVSGMGTALVVATGDHTYVAAMSAKLTEMPGLNAFERGVRRVSYILVPTRKSLTLLEGMCLDTHVTNSSASRSSWPR
ncbi:hypothetical protein AMAG_11214 [Allomyces macrogynus ATCC 38327]|uniref:P-type ATPase A domain-containing protein n=1 Tax=Allomyces macrogynus (strain ATCC 38327) TaxID=578462 RepID=A0A0L0SW67_ALLM3|nr:hypothetical protein AMAG_11214 [Allomyces macrogynus ATCC 38327]|eukprot:KNE66716.1 hypothetical protein AMAG_11214 [Allomyces macrogynus ATCC 38327]